MKVFFFFLDVKVLIVKLTDLKTAPYTQRKKEKIESFGKKLDPVKATYTRTTCGSAGKGTCGAGRNP